MDEKYLDVIIKLSEDNGALKKENEILKEKVQVLNTQLESEKARRRPFKSQLNK